MFPETSYDVFARFVSHRLARDETQLQARFGRGAKQIAEIAEIVAFTMTADIAIGLSPTRAELAAAVGRQGFELQRIELSRSLDALEYMRLAKIDTTTQSALSDRPFSFAHRRFQEFFATRIVVAKPAIVPPDALLLDARWRETAIVLCQLGGGTDANEGLRQEALRMIQRWLAEAPNSSATGHGSWGGAYVWPRRAYHVLAILQAGFAASREAAIESLRENASSFLTAIYSRGDLLDKKQVIELAGIVPSSHLLAFLQSGLATGSEWLDDVIFRQVARLPAASYTVQNWIRYAIIRQAFSKEFGGHRSSMRAYAARLPNGERMRWIATYAPLIKPIDMAILAAFSAIVTSFDGLSSIHSYTAIASLTITIIFAKFSPKFLPILYTCRLIGYPIFWVRLNSETVLDSIVAVYGLLWAPLAVMCARLDLVKKWSLLFFIPVIGVLWIIRIIAVSLFRLTQASPKLIFEGLMNVLRLVRKNWPQTTFYLACLASWITAETTPVIDKLSRVAWLDRAFSILSDVLRGYLGISFLGWIFWWIYKIFQSLIERRRILQWLDQSNAGLDGEAISDRLQSLKKHSSQTLMLREVRKRKLLRPSESGELALRRFARTTKSATQRDIAFRLAETINLARQ